jgi:hypothetical protein
MTVQQVKDYISKSEDWSFCLKNLDP